MPDHNNGAACTALPRMRRANARPGLVLRGPGFPGSQRGVRAPVSAKRVEVEGERMRDALSVG